jgi:rod shape-determining protein MreD
VLNSVEEVRSGPFRPALIIIAAILLQVAVANRLPLPGSVTPDLVMLTVVALALFKGEMVGIVAGFAAGLASDLVPPADHAIGTYALVYCIVGYLAGLVSPEMERSQTMPFLAVALGALLGNLIYAVIGMMLGDPRADWSIVSRMVPLAVLYNVLASPFVVWAVLKVSQRSERLEPRGGLTVPGYASRLGRQSR